MMRRVGSLFLLFVVGCSDEPAGPPPELEVIVTEESAATFRDFVAFIGDARVGVRVAADPVAEISGATEGPARIAVAGGIDCSECFELERIEPGVIVRGDGLGVQYGLAHVLEAMGYRFYHPWRSLIPEAIALPALDGDLGRRFEPEMRRRGLHIHTLHPIEGLFDLWEPGEESLVGAKRIVDWMVKNRGNYIEWVALDNIQAGPAAAEQWMAHEEQIVDYAHLRGLSVGVNIQLFGASNLQRSFDLLDREDIAEPRAVIRDRLSVIVPEPGFDEVSLSFGEFSATDPAVFVDSVNLVSDALSELDPELTMSAHIHVGNYEETRVTYMGEELLYYFLVKFADPRIVPYVHTVMFYDLFEDAGGAYLHDDFSEHREYLLGRLRAGERVVYYPESAYWVAFDNSVPQYFPLYVRSRWLDVHSIAEIAAAEGFSPLDEHVLFSTGWEWGYWQVDYATLRLGWALPDRWEALFEDMFAPYGAGEELAAAVADLVRAQHTAMIDQRLTAYVAGRDAVIDIGDAMGIFSQPDRPSFEEVVAMDATAHAAFVTGVLEPLAAYAAAVEAALARLRATGEDDPFVQELLDGFEADLHRARFAHAVFSAAAAKAIAAPVEPHLQAASDALAAARAPVARRHGALHDPDPQSLLRRRRNATLYQHGYLFYADNLCYWERELIEVRNATTGASESLPACVL